MLDEKKLIHNLKQPSTREAAYYTLVCLYKERLYWNIRGIVKNHDDTDDVLQNTFIKVYKNIQNFKGESKLYTWLYRISTNEAINSINKKAKRLQISSQELQEKAIENLKTDVYFQGDSFELLLQKAISTLPNKQQQVFRMKYFEKNTFEELSEILDTSVGGLKSSYHIAVKKIKQFLKTNETFY